MLEDTDAQPRYKYSEAKDHEENKQLVVERKELEMTEHKKPYQRPHRHIEW
jgi:hypothetical protein